MSFQVTIDTPLWYEHPTGTFVNDKVAELVQTSRSPDNPFLCRPTEFRSQITKQRTIYTYNKIQYIQQNTVHTESY